MNNYKTSLSGYGACELKATYQRNMMIGTLMTATAVFLAVASLYIYQAMQPALVIIDIGPDPTGGVITLPPPPPDPIGRPPEKGTAQKREIVKAGIPVPVHEDELLGEDVVIQTRDQLAKIVDGLYSLIDIDSDKNIVYGFEEPEDEYPEPTDWVPCEIYPKMAYEAIPEFPRMAKLTGIGGTVWVKALVDKNGDVRDVIILKSSNSVFDASAKRAAMKCKFSPAIQNNIPISVWVSFSFDFEMNN